MGERCTVEGTVQHVIFQNEENGYTVLGLLTEEGELVTVVGCIPCVAPGEKLTADGLWVSHPSCSKGRPVKTSTVGSACCSRTISALVTLSSRCVIRSAR